MPLKILKTIQDTRNELMKRRELRLLVNQDSITPSKADVEKLLVEIEKAPLENISVEHIYQKYGKRVSEVVANIYDKPPVKKEKAKKVKEGEAAPAAPAPAPKEKAKEEKKKE